MHLTSMGTISDTFVKVGVWEDSDLVATVEIQIGDLIVAGKGTDDALLINLCRQQSLCCAFDVSEEAIA